MITLALLVLVLAAVVGFILTGDLGAPEAQNPHPRKTPLVDERPLLTARNVAKLASDWDEKRFADQALRLSDNEVDLAFEDALRDAEDHPAAPTPGTRELYAHVTQAEVNVKADQDRLNQLKKQLAAASSAHQDAAQEQVDLAQAQLDLDQDELDDAKEDLSRSGADPLSRIQRQLKRHKETEHGTTSTTSVTPEAPSTGTNLLAQFNRWHALRGISMPLLQASDETIQGEAALSRAHDSLEKQVNAEKASKRAIATPAGTSNPTPTSNPAAPVDVASLRRFSDDQKNLSDFDKRIQDEQELGTNYGSWIALVKSQQRAALHSMMQSALWILLIVLLGYLADRWIEHMLTEKVAEGTRLHTLRVVIRSSVQAVGLLLVLLVVFGAPSQTPTILGLAGAGITVAMKDFIVAFFGWFVLMGKNGLRVGDWVEINGVAGEVVEINLLRTVLLETGNWNETGHPTGRKVAFVNNYAIEGHFFNFTTTGQWLWDELKLSVPSDQDPYPLLDAIQKAVVKETEVNANAAEKEWKNNASQYKVSSVSAAPTVNLSPTPAGVEIHVRYISRAQERSAIRARLNQALVGLMHHREAEKKESMSAAK
ncbi:MAG: mechanosensitive ion channel domain-containing protein [Terriglobales bacterium]